MDQTEVKKAVEEKPQKTGKKKKINPFLIYVFIMLIATAVSLAITLSRNFSGVVNAFKSCDYRWILVANAVVLLTFMIDALVILIFMRLYTTKYHYHQALAVSTIGAFYAGITPGGSGGQVTQAVTLKKQGSQISNAASILVMYFILYKTALLILEIITVAFKWRLMGEIGSIPVKIGAVNFSIPLAPLTIIGFIFTIVTTSALFLMSYSHKFHNLVMHYGVGFLARMHLVKNPDKTRENLRIQVENYKIELRRLLSNIRVTILILLLLVVMLIIKFSLPWFIGIALNGYGKDSAGGFSFSAFMDACFMSNYHTMIMSLIPIPGSAGVSEVFFNKLFENYYINAGVVSAAQILWRTVSFYIPLIVTCIFTFSYRSSPKKEEVEINRKTFVTMQLATYEERKFSSDTLYETSQNTRKEFQSRIREVLLPKLKKDKNEKKNYKLDDSDLNDVSPFSLNNELREDNSLNKKKKKKHNKDDNEWRDFNIK